MNENGCLLTYDKTDRKEAQEGKPSYKIVCPINSHSVNILKLMLSNFANEIISLYPFYSLVVLTDSNLTTIWYCKNSSLMHKEIKLCPGLSLKEEYTGKTAISESLKKNSFSVLKSEDGEGTPLNKFSSCAAPITLDNGCAYIGAFFLSSMAENLSIDLFKLFLKSIENSFKNRMLKDYVTDYVKSNMLSVFDVNILTSSEKKILSLLKNGYSNKELAAMLSISENTVKSHIKIIIEKLSCSNRTQAAVNAIFYDIYDILKNCD